MGQADVLTIWRQAARLRQTDEISSNAGREASDENAR